MRTRTCLAIAAAIALLSPFHSKASVTIEISATLLGQSTSAFDPLAPGSLLQLINLGADGVFNPLTFTGGEGGWVAGDDSLLLVSFTISGGLSDFDSAAAFDLSVGADTPGMLSRVIIFDSDAVPAGTKLGLRWFPGIAANTFDPLLGPSEGQVYGEFTRQTSGVHGGTPWMTPSDGAAVSFDPLVTVSQGGSDPNAAGLPGNLVTVVPEPGSFLLGLLGAAYLASRRPRRVR